MKTSHPSRSITDQTLAEQLQINDREIQSRKSLLNFTWADEQALLKLRPMVDDNVDGIVAEFYEHQLNGALPFPVEISLA